jgi:Family of unknown function (DUF6328)
MADNLSVLETVRSSGTHRLRPAVSELDQDAGHARTPAPVRQPSRVYAEILQEIRIAQTGSQVLLGFLLSLGFTERFSMLDRPQETLYVGALSLNVAATALLVAPTAFRQLTFRSRMEHQTSTAANRLVMSGLTLLMCAIIGSLLFALSAVFGFGLGVSIALGALVWFTSWWYVFPMWSRVRHGRRTGGSTDEPEHLVPRARRTSA